MTARPNGQALLRALEIELPSGSLTLEPDDLATYGRDWTRVFAPAPLAIAFPRTTEHVVHIVRRCREEGVAIVPSGGRTGLAGGAVAMRGELVVSLEKMRSVGVLDQAGGTLRVEAGAVTAAVHEHAGKDGWTWPVDFASKGSSQVGGNIATNAGGVKVIRYGLTRNWVLGLQVVLASGEVLELDHALEKNNTGIDLRQLFIGSEGVLGLITAATLKLCPLPGPSSVMLLAVSDLPSVVRLFEAARHAPFLLSAFEFFTDRCFARVARHRRLSMPLATPATHYVLIEAEAPLEAIEAWLGDVMSRELVLDGTLSANAAQARALWELRESISESLSATGFPHKNDIALPVGALDAFCAEIEQVFGTRWPGFEICLFGHIGDGNLHVNVMKPDDMAKEVFLAHAHESDQAMFELVRKHRGSISAEHGIGLLKKDFLHYSRSESEVATMRAIKRALDPEALMNPGKVF